MKVPTIPEDAETRGFIKRDVSAFPLPDAYMETGMTLRDYFAAKAMQSYLSSDYENCGRDPDKLAFWAYENADAMLKAREEAP